MGKCGCGGGGDGCRGVWKYRKFGKWGSLEVENLESGGVGKLRSWEHGFVNKEWGS